MRIYNNSLRRTLSFALLMGIVQTPLHAAEAPLPPTIEPPAATDDASPVSTTIPELPEQSDSRKPVAPEVNIIHRKDATVEEYRINGRLRYARITPKVGKPYYMYDSDGDGVLDKRDNNFENPPINQWLLLEW